MSEVGDSVRDRVARREWIERSDVDAFAAVPNDLDLWSAVYEAFAQDHCRIHPVPDLRVRCAFMVEYLLRCVRENPPSNHVHSGYEAAWELAACLNSWSSKLPESQSALQLAEQKITAMYRAGDESVRDRLLNGTLEHALESDSVRPFFAHWEHDPVLGEAWQLAMQWAVAHGDSAAQ
jgi:hypothetical protein